MQDNDGSQSGTSISVDSLGTDSDQHREDLILKDEKYVDDDVPVTSEPSLFCRRMKRIGVCQLLIALACITISIPLTIEVDRRSAGSGIWCPIFFATMGGLNVSSAGKLKSIKVMWSFAITSIYFAGLMLCVELIELSITVGEQSTILTVGLVLHSILVMLASCVILLTILSIIICYRENKAYGKQNKFNKYNDRRSSEILYSEHGGLDAVIGRKSRSTQHC
uniref:Uncharacterized LOC100179925 n=1 Tax=Ciona intestinalis TaxID=7719 RepID=F6W8B6_CIOIN|nr:uncharacterized protein LOC100179925 [Ciona intestinalis]|eukprot:XP_002127774.1 uncharacterized protein LOC100179925 [Ciona intestinalis]